MGRRNGGDCCARCRGRFSPARRGAAAPQRERHPHPVSSESLVCASSERKRDCAKGSRPASRIKIMPQVPIIMPQLGESIAEATIVDIKIKPGDEVVDDQEIIDVETNKAVMGVTTPCKGKIDKITVQLKETYPVGAVLGYVEASEADAARFAKQAPPPPQREVAEEIPVRADQEVMPVRQDKIPARGRDGAGAGGLPVPATL